MSLNRATLLGRVGQDPTIKNFDNGNKIASFSLATTEKGFKTESGIDVPERTEWHNIIVRSGLATVAEKYIKKGSNLYVEGKIRNRSYESQGVKRYITEIYADSLLMLDGKPTEQQSTQHNSPEPVQQPQQHISDVLGPEGDLPF